MEALRALSREFTRACLRRAALARLVTVFVAAGSALCLNGQEAGTGQSQAAARPVSLKELIDEVERNNPEIVAAQRGYEASTHLARQASALPDTQVMLQLFSVGSPKPFAGYTNSDFSYIGVGFSQEIPYPGKRDLRAQ